MVSTGTTFLAYRLTQSTLLKEASLRAFALSFVLGITASVSSAQWAEGESMLARKATFDARLTISSASFNPATVVCYQLPLAGSVRLVVYDFLGREVTTLVDENKPAGVHTVQFVARDLASGVYLYRMQAGSFSSVRRFVLMK